MARQSFIVTATSKHNPEHFIQVANEGVNSAVGCVHDFLLELDDEWDQIVVQIGSVKELQS